MHISSSTLTPTYHVPTCGVTEYNLPTEKLGIATAEIDGRYPLTGQSRNNVCEQTSYVVSGSGTIYTKGSSYTVKPGDVFFFDIGERYYVEGDQLEVIIYNTPARSVDQYEMSENE